MKSIDFVPSAGAVKPERKIAMEAPTPPQEAGCTEDPAPQSPLSLLPCCSLHRASNSLSLPVYTLDFRTSPLCSLLM